MAMARVTHGRDMRSNPLCFAEVVVRKLVDDFCGTENWRAA